MKECKLCPKTIPKDSPFTDYCSVECEKKAVREHGMQGGTRRGLNFFSVLVLIVIGVVFLGIKECNSNKKEAQSVNISPIQDSIANNEREANEEIHSVQNYGTENTVQNENEKSPSTDSDIYQNEENISKPEPDTVNQTAQNNNFRMVQYQKHQEALQLATELLNENKSIDEIVSKTSLTRKEIRQLRRKLKNEE